MTIYLDTSALAKLYMEESGAEEMRRLVGGATQAATSMVAYAEMRSALARKMREGGISGTDYRGYLGKLDGQWASFLRIEASEDVVRSAGNLAERRLLRGMDAIHLASALFLAHRAHGDRILFACADERLARAARGEGMEVCGGNWEQRSSGDMEACERGPRWRRTHTRRRGG